MKLLVDAHCFDYKTTEGINTYLSGLYVALLKQAPDVEFYFMAANIEKVKSIFGQGENIHYIELSSKNKIYRLLFEIPHIIHKYGIDAAHYQYTSPLIKNCRTIITLHDILFKDYPSFFSLSYRLSKGLLFKLSAKRADLLLTVSEYSRDRISLHYHIPKARIFVTPNAVSSDFMHIDEREAKSFVGSKGIEKYLLYVSRIEPRKNQVALLRAYLDLNLSLEGYHLVFIGRRTLPTPDFDNLLESLPEEQQKFIHVYNQVDYNDLKLWYKAASLFVYPALAEGFGIPPIEAGMAEIPCICSNKTAMGDFVFFGRNLIDVTDSKVLKDTIMANLKNHPDVKNISKAIREKYNWDAIAHEFNGMLRSLD